MARDFNGSSGVLTSGSASLLDGATSWTVGVWVKPNSMTPTSSIVAKSGDTTANWWGIRAGETAGQFSFDATGHTGADPATDSGIAITEADWSSGAWLAWRLAAPGGEWSKWKNGEKTLINAALSTTLAATAGAITVGASGAGSLWFLGDIAELAIWSVGLTDAEMSAHGRGVAAWHFARPFLVGYWRISGNSATEPDYSKLTFSADGVPSFGVGLPLSVTGTVRSDFNRLGHPATYGPDVLRQSAPAWVLHLDFFSPTPDVYSASRDLYDPLTYDIFGRPLDGHIINSDSIEITEASDVGIEAPRQATVICRNTDDTQAFDLSRDWRTAGGAILRQYDPLCLEVVTRLAGIVVDDPTYAEAIQFTISSYDPAELETLLPRAKVNVDQHPTASDLGAPIPWVFGVAQVSPPFIKRDEDTDPGGRWFACSWLAYNDIVGIQAVWADEEPGAPGLESLDSWSSAPGSPVRVTDTTFTVSSTEIAATYKDQTPVRVLHSGAYSYGFVNGTPSGTTTVTVSPGIVLAGFTAIQIGAEYLVDKTTVSAGSTPKAILCIRSFLELDGGYVVQVKNLSTTNPADVIHRILAEPVVGLKIGGVRGVDAAAAELSAAGLGAAINGSIGGDRQQRTARAVLTEILDIARARLWKSADPFGWTIAVDGPAAAPTRTLGYGDGHWNNILSKPTRIKTPLGEAIKTLILNYQPGSRVSANRDGGTTWLNVNAFDYSIRHAVLPFGREETITTNWIRAGTTTGHAIATKYLAYKALRLRTEDIRYELNCGPEMRNLQLGERVTLEMPLFGVSAGDYRVRTIKRRLADIALTVVPYDADMYSDTTGITYEDGAGAVTQVDGADKENKRRPPGQSGNLIVNPDFSIAMRKTAHIHGDAVALPGWILSGSSSHVTYTITQDRRAIGGYYLTAVVTNAAAEPAIVVNRDLTSSYDSSRGYLPAKHHGVHLFSVYCDQTEGWKTQQFFTAHDAGGAVTGLHSSFPAVRVIDDDQNGLGWKRHFVAVRAVLTSGTGTLVSAQPSITFTANGTYKFDAVDFRWVVGGTRRPPLWQRNPQSQLQPEGIPSGFAASATGGGASFASASIQARAEVATEHAFAGSAEKVITVTGAQFTNATASVAITGTSQIDEGMCLVDAVCEVTTTIGGPTTIDVGFGAPGDQSFALGLSTTAGDPARASKYGVGPWHTPRVFAEDTPIYITANGGNFNGTGTLKIRLNYSMAVLPA